MADTPDRSRWVLIASLGLIAAAVGSYLLVPPFHAFVDQMLAVMTSDDPERMHAWVSQFGWKGPALIVALMTVQMFLVVIPSWLLMVMAVLAYGPFPGAAISIVAVLVASSIGYAIGAALGEQALARLLGARTERRVREEACRYGAWAVVIARLSPFLSNDAISFIAGLVRMGYLRFLIATFAGIAPLAALIAAFGRDADTMKTGLVWVSLLGVAALAGWIWYDRRVGRRRET